MLYFKSREEVLISLFEIGRHGVAGSHTSRCPHFNPLTRGDSGTVLCVDADTGRADCKLSGSAPGGAEACAGPEEPNAPKAWRQGGPTQHEL
jgi:hypothetical protein